MAASYANYRGWSIIYSDGRSTGASLADTPRHPRHMLAGDVAAQEKQQQHRGHSRVGEVVERDIDGIWFPARVSARVKEKRGVQLSLSLSFYVFNTAVYCRRLDDRIYVRLHTGSRISSLITGVFFLCIRDTDKDHIRESRERLDPHGHWTICMMTRPLCICTFYSSQ